jgi:predicted ABC-type ATPase
MPQPRIRMFAGPNGSGKSTVKEYLLPHHIEAYLNADELERMPEYDSSIKFDGLSFCVKSTRFD